MIEKNDVGPVRATFHGMGTEVTLALWPEATDDETACETLTREIAFLRLAEELLSRFQPDSEISRLNRGTSEPLRVSTLTFGAISVAIEAARSTSGLFDPTVHGALLAAGYDRDFADVAAGAQQRAAEAHAPWQAGRWREVTLDADRLTVALPAGVALDLGGIAKGWLADQVADRLARCGAALADIGGDIAFRGLPPDADGWLVDVEGPFGGTLGTLRLHGDGGVATSGTTRRRWQTAAGPQHHLIDPRTGLPALTDLLSVTVAAPFASSAEVAAKGVLLLGQALGRVALANARQHGAVLVGRDGSLVTVGDLDWSPETSNAFVEARR
jgi:thiamine biosynthesis lipoprotein